MKDSKKWIEQNINVAFISYFNFIIINKPLCKARAHTELDKLIL